MTASAVEGQPAWNPALTELAPRNTMSGASAAFWAVGVNLVFPLVVALVLLAKAIRLGKEAIAADELERGADAAPARGNRLVRGVVETKRPAVVVTIHQYGKETSSKGSWSTQWTETSRTITARPFVLVMANGMRLRCEPDRKTKLIDGLDVTKRLTLETRVRRAELSRGETAIVRGRIDEAIGRGGRGGYREPGRELVLRPGPDGMMISTKGLAAPLRSASSQRSKWACWFLVMAAVGGCIALPWVHSSLAGHVEVGSLVRFGSHSVKTKNGYSVIGDISYTVGNSGTEHTDEVDRSFSSGWYVQGTPLPVHVSPLATRIGTRAVVSGPYVILNTVGLVIGSLLAAMMMSAPGHWYEQKQLSESRAGKLEDDWTDRRGG